MQQIEWRKKYLWDVLFPDAPKPFDKFFPASEIEEGLSNLRMEEFSIAGKVLATPISSNLLSVRLTFNDDEASTLENWLREWMDTIILNEGQYVSTLDLCARMLIVQKLNSLREPISQNSYWVVPFGELTHIGSSDSEADIKSLDFQIVGKIE